MFKTNGVEVHNYLPVLRDIYVHKRSTRPESHNGPPCVIVETIRLFQTLNLSIMLKTRAQNVASVQFGREYLCFSSMHDINIATPSSGYASLPQITGTPFTNLNYFLLSSDK